MPDTGAPSLTRLRFPDARREPAIVKKVTSSVLAGTLAAALAAALAQQPASAAMRADAPSQVDGQATAAAHRPDNRPGPLTKQQDKLRCSRRRGAARGARDEEGCRRWRLDGQARRRQDGRVLRQQQAGAGALDPVRVRRHRGREVRRHRGPAAQQHPRTRPHDRTTRPPGSPTSTRRTTTSCSTARASPSRASTSRSRVVATPPTAPSRTG